MSCSSVEGVGLECGAVHSRFEVAMKDGRRAGVEVRTAGEQVDHRSKECAAALAVIVHAAGEVVDCACVQEPLESM